MRLSTASLPPARTVLGLLPSSGLAGLAFVALAVPAPAQAPPGYYDTVDTSTSLTLRQTLHEVIDDHVRFPYTSGSTDTWDILELAQEDPANPTRIVDVYRNRSFVKQGGGNSFYNREHAWPVSYGFPDDNSSNYPFTDCHSLFLSDDGYNINRSNKPFRDCSPQCQELTTDATNGSGGGSGSYPGNSNWTSGSFSTGRWEVWGDRRGDIARAMFYMDVRYEGGTHGTTFAQEPDLVLTDSIGLISQSNTGQNESLAYMGVLSDLLQWHADDPVSPEEITRNDVVFAFQGNRNPFVDHPEWIDCLYGGGVCQQDVFCDASDGSLVACPCANPGAPDSGCEIQQGTGGVSLEVVAQETAALNRATLRGFGFPTAQIPSAVVIRSSGLDPAAPVVFGDGVRCVGTPLVRLGANIAISGVSDHAFGHGAMAGAGEFYYQLWFRNTPAMYCTPDAFNLSNGRTLTW